MKHLLTIEGCFKSHDQPLPELIQIVSHKLRKRSVDKLFCHRKTVIDMDLSWRPKLIAEKHGMLILKDLVTAHGMEISLDNAAMSKFLFIWISL